MRRAISGPPPGRITTTPAQFDFGQQLVKSTSGARTVSVTNSASQAFPLQIGVTGDFTADNGCGTPLGGGQTCTLHVTFTPQDLGVRTGQISFGDGVPPLALTGLGMPPAPEAVLCYVFNDGYTDMAGPADSIYISGRGGDRGCQLLSTRMADVF